MLKSSKIIKNNKPNSLREQLLKTKEKLEVQKNRNKLISDFVDETSGNLIDPKVTLDILKNSIEFKDSLSLIELNSICLKFISSDVIKKIAVLECITPDPNSINGVNSPKMGVTEAGKLCSTCTLSKKECTGHIGYISLAEAFFHPLAIDYIKLVLDCICEECGNVALSSKIKKSFLNLNKPAHKKLKDISKRTLNSGQCYNFLNGKCSNSIPKNKIRYDSPKNTDGSHINKKIKKLSNDLELNQVVSAETVKNIFQRISDFDLAVMGFKNGSTPVNFILEVLPVISPKDRPKHKSKEDDLTNAYRNILKKNMSLKEVLYTEKFKENINKNEIRKNLWSDIKYLMNNNVGEKKINGKNIQKALNTLLSGKKGYCRKGSQAKRVDFSGRSVIGGAECEFGWSILPAQFRNFTIKEKVFDMNIQRIKEAARNGQIVKFMKKGSVREHIFEEFAKREIGRKRMQPKLENLDMENMSEEDIDFIDIGDIVFRQATAGDDVFINRQPTLHKHSIIGTRGIFHENKNTIQIHMSYTPPLGADFDGDEMNVHLPQTLTARSELRHIMNASKQIIKSDNSSPIMGLIFNCPTAAFLISEDLQSYEIISETEENSIIDYLLDNMLNKEDYYNRLKKYNVARRTPQALFSMLFPPDFNYSTKIKEGIYIGGKLEKSDINKKIIKSLFVKYGESPTVFFLSKGQFLLDFFIERRGFTIGLKDFILKDHKIYKEQLDSKIEEIRKNVSVLEKKVLKTDIERRNNQENIIQALTAPIDEEFGKMIISQKNEEDNNFVIMVNSKSKGGFKNITRVMGIVGQQMFKSNRFSRTLYGNRTICYFEPNDTSIEGRGFSTKGFLEGIDPAACYFQASETRVGLLNTALGTAEVGALTKKISKVMESEMVNYDGGVIDALGNYTSLSYDDGYSREHLINITDFKTLNNENISGIDGIYLPYDLIEILKDINLIS